MHYSRTSTFAALATLLLHVPLSAATSAGEIHFSKLHRSYTNLVSDLAPIVQGPLTLRMSSPSHVLTVKDTRLRMTAAPAGTQAIHLEIDLSGKGWLVGDVEASGMTTRLQDELFVLPQTVVLDAKVRLRRAASGFVVEALELPAQVEVQIQSRLTSELLQWCTGISIFAGFDCSGLERALTRIAVPLPAAAGAAYELPDSELTAEERQQIQKWLE
jgi:hypothetical protein